MAHAVPSAVLPNLFRAGWPKSPSQTHTDSREAQVALIKGEVLSQGDLTQSFVEGCQPRSNALRPLRKEGAAE